MNQLTEHEAMLSEIAAAVARTMDSVKRIAKSDVDTTDVYKSAMSGHVYRISTKYKAGNIDLWVSLIEELLRNDKN